MQDIWGKKSVGIKLENIFHRFHSFRLSGAECAVCIYITVKCLVEMP